MMSGDSIYHKKLEQELADFVGKPAGYLMNFGYQGMVSIIDVLTTRHDVIVYDSESHACILDGLRLSLAKRFVYKHNNMESLEQQLNHAMTVAQRQNGAILVITEGVFGMAGDVGKLDEIVALKKKYPFRLLVDDAHGFGTMGKNGSGVGEYLNCQAGIDVSFGTFAKSMAGIGGFVASEREIIDYLRFNMRSQIFAKSLPMPMVIGGLKRLELLRTRPELKEKLWTIVTALQNGLKEKGFDIGKTNSPVTPVYLKGGVDEGCNVVVDLRENYGIFCSIVVYPVVAKDVLMLRLIPTAVHTLEDVTYTINVFSEMQEKLAQGFYNKPFPNMKLT
jgi:glycine C-acetyltransferase